MNQQPTATSSSSTLPSTPGQNATLAVAQEEIQVGKQKKETAQVVVHITPQTHQQVVEIPLADEHIQVSRVPINQPIDQPPAVRQEGQVTIIPVVEEILVVEKRLMLKEEIHIHRQRTMHTERREVTLRNEEAHILRSADPAEENTPDPSHS